MSDTVLHSSPGTTRRSHLAAPEPPSRSHTPMPGQVGEVRRGVRAHGAGGRQAAVPRVPDEQRLCAWDCCEQLCDGRRLPPASQSDSIQGIDQWIPSTRRDPARPPRPAWRPLRHARSPASRRRTPHRRRRVESQTRPRTRLPSVVHGRAASCTRCTNFRPHAAPTSRRPTSRVQMRWCSSVERVVCRDRKVAPVGGRP